MIGTNRRQGTCAPRTRLITVVCLLLVAMCGWWLQDRHDDLAQINAWLQCHRVVLSLCRTVLALGAIWRWDRIAHWLYPARTEQARQQRQLFIAQRWRLLGAFAFIEIVLANNLFAILVGAVT